MGIRFRSYSAYGLGYCPTMSWSAIIMVNSVCDTYTSFATRLHIDLYTFWEIFGWVWFLKFCIQQLWACKFTVSLCLLLLVRRSEAKRVETKRGEVTSRRIFFGHLVAEFVYIKFYYMDMEMEQMFVRIVEWGVGWLTTKLLCVECVAVSTIAPVCHTKELYRIDLSQRLWYNRFVLCELEFSSSWTLCLVRRA